MIFQDPIEMNVSDLAFDLQNPRLAEYNLPEKPNDSQIMEVLWEAMDVRELVMSIAASGFFRHEPMIVAKEDEKNIVIEGNRRLAAVKSLLNPTLVAVPETNIPQIDKEAKDALKTLPIIVRTREEAWRYIGFKHVNGPAKWSSYAKAQYIAKVHSEYGIALQDIASQIGDTHSTVQRLFRGMMVIEQAESMGLFDRDDRWRQHFSFSHLYVGLQYTGISSFLGLRPQSDEETKPVPNEKANELRELCVWLYGNKEENKPPVVQSQNPHLRQLDAVVANREAVAALRANGNLSVAFEMSKPPSNVFEDSIYAAKRNLEKALSLSSTGYEGSRELLLVVEFKRYPESSVGLKKTIIFKECQKKMTLTKQFKKPMWN